MGESRILFDPQLRLSCKEVFPVLRGWKNLVRIEQHANVYDGTIAEVSDAAGTLEFSTVITGEGKKTLVFELAGADFQQFAELNADWDDVFMVFPKAGDWFLLRKWKR
jgi:hypothetical protein